MPSFIDITSQPTLFFDILPDDWRQEIEPKWGNYTTDSHIFGIKEKERWVAGGIVFGSVSPDTQGYAATARQWFDKGYLYVGFIYVLPDHQGRGLGTFWLNELRKAYPNQPFWLAIEDVELVRFYEPLGFTVRQEVTNDGTQEWILSM